MDSFAPRERGDRPRTYFILTTDFMNCGPRRFCQSATSDLGDAIAVFDLKHDLRTGRQVQQDGSDRDCENRDQSLHRLTTSRATQQFVDGATNVRRPHQGLAHQHCVSPARLQTIHIGP